jgi:hypothetical protein
MRTLHLAAFVGAAFMGAASPAAAHCCGQPIVGYGIAPAAAIVPPDALDPWYPVRQIYVVNQGPVFTGPGIYAYSNFYVPTAAPYWWDGGYSPGRYPYAPPFPYVRGEFGCHAGVERCDYGYWRYWRRPYAAYRYRPGARAIHPRY